MKEVSKKRMKKEIKYYFRKRTVSKFTGLGRRNLCRNLQKLDNMRRKYDMVTVSKDQTVSIIYIGAGGS
jgi:hypothetical protein